MSQKQPPPGYFYKVLCVAPLSGDAKAVGGALLDHRNTATGQCDPSQASLARRLGIARRTVIDALNELVTFGIFERRRHGGKGHRSSYRANFGMAALMATDFEARRKGGVEPSETSPMHPKNRPPKRSRRAKGSGNGATTSGRQNGGNGATLPSGTVATATGGTVATQTLLKNTSNLTLRAQSEKTQAPNGGSIVAPRPPKTVSRQMTEMELREAQRRTEAPQAWQRDLLEYSRDLYFRIVPTLTETDPVYVEATSAELARPGGGLASILAAATGLAVFEPFEPKTGTRRRQP